MMKPLIRACSLIFIIVLFCTLHARGQGKEIKSLNANELRLAKDFFEAIKNNDEKKYASLFSSPPDRSERKDVLIGHRNRMLAYLNDYNLYRSNDFGVIWNTAGMGICYKDENDAIVIQVFYTGDGIAVAELRIGEVTNDAGRISISSRSKTPINASPRIVGNDEVKP